MRKILAILATALTLVLTTGPATWASETGGRSWHTAATLTDKGWYTELICDKGVPGYPPHAFNDHYWRVGFCTGDYKQYPQIIELGDKGGKPYWSAFEDAREGFLARIALSRGTPPIFRGWNQNCSLVIYVQAHVCGALG